MQVLDHEGKVLREAQGSLADLLQKAGLELQKEEVAEVRIVKKPLLLIPGERRPGRSRLVWDKETQSIKTVSTVQREEKP